MFEQPVCVQTSDLLSQPGLETHHLGIHQLQSSDHASQDDQEMLSWLQSMHYMRSVNTPQPENTTILSDQPLKSIAHVSAGISSLQLKPPAPSYRVKKQKSRICLACGEADCRLISHKYYSQIPKHVSPLTSSPEASIVKQKPHPSLRRLNLVPPALPSNMEQRFSAEQQYLLGLWSQKWSPRAVRVGPERHLFPIKWIDKILPITSKDATLRQALCAFSAAAFGISHDAIEGIATASLETAVQLLTQASPNVSSAFKDENLLAAAMIALIYANMGDELSFKQHYERIVQLVKRRGGLYYLGLSGIVAETLMHLDYFNSIIYECHPTWTLVLPALNIGLPPRQGHAFRTFLATNSIDQEVAQAACDLSKVVDILSLYGSPTAPAAAIASWGYLTNIAEYQLAKCNANFHDTTTLEECVCLALNLLNLAVLRFEGFVSPVAHKLEKRFWTSLALTETKIDIIGTNPALYLWMLITGITTEICDESDWRNTAVGKIRVVSQLCGVHSWQTFKEDILDEHIWLRSAQEEAYTQVWLDAAGLPAIAV